MKLINTLKDDIKGKMILLRVDFDVPIDSSEITNSELRVTEDFRIKKQKETLDYLLKMESTVVMVAHASEIDSFKSILNQLENILNYKINFISDIDSLQSTIRNSQSGNLFLLDNIRKWPGEKENDDSFARGLAEGFDFYVNNAFAVCHRQHASVSAVTRHLPSYAGYLLALETEQLQKFNDLPVKGKTLIMGGAKAETKVPVIKNFMDKAEHILVGGVVANDILKVRGVDIGRSIADDNAEELLKGLDVESPIISVPEDFNINENKILDIGPETIKKYSSIITGSKAIIWNGPMGLFEDDRFVDGTKAIVEAITSSNALKIVGGGDSIAAIDKFGMMDKFDFISTGGGAMLAFLAGERLPGLEALGYYRKIKN